MIRVLSLQESGCYIALFAYYGIAVPASLILCFQLDFDVNGLWVAMAMGSSLQAILYARLTLWQTDWDQVAEESQKLLTKPAVESTREVGGATTVIEEEQLK